MSIDSAYALWIQMSVLDLVRRSSLGAQIVFAILIVFSIASWAIILSKWNVFRQARAANVQFLKVFRKASGLEMW